MIDIFWRVRQGQYMNKKAGAVVRFVLDPDDPVHCEKVHHLLTYGSWVDAATNAQIMDSPEEIIRRGRQLKNQRALSRLAATLGVTDDVSLDKIISEMGQGEAPGADDDTSAEKLNSIQKAVAKSADARKRRTAQKANKEKRKASPKPKRGRPKKAAEQKKEYADEKTAGTSKPINYERCSDKRLISLCTERNIIRKDDESLLREEMIMLLQQLDAIKNDNTIRR